MAYAIVSKENSFQSTEVDCQARLKYYDPRCADGRDLMLHQPEAVQWMLRRPFFILADDMGLGKTRSSIVAIRSLQQFHGGLIPIYIFCPAGVMSIWQEEIDMVGGIVNYKILSNNYGSIPDPIRDQNFLLIIDEAHEYKNIAAERTYRMLQFAGTETCQSCLLLSGTPVKNGSPLDIYPLLKMARHPLGNDYGFFCRSAKRNSLKYLAMLFKAIKIDDPCLLERSKDEVLNLPGKRRTLDACELTPEEQAAYDQIFAGLREEYFNRLREGKASGAAAALVMLQHLRRASSWGKIRGTVERTRKFLEDGQRAVLIFTSFQESATTIAQAFNAEVLDGRATKKHRALMVKDFQSGKTKVLVCTINSGGVGLTLTKATKVILHDRDWTSTMSLQAEDRAYRIGQDSEVECIWPQSTKADRIMDAKVLEKQKIIDLIVRGKISDYATIEDIGKVSMQIDAAEALAEIFAD